MAKSLEIRADLLVGKYFEMFALGCCLASFTVMQQRCHSVYLVELPFELQCKKKRRMGDMKCRVVAVFFFNHCIVFVFLLCSSKGTDVHFAAFRCVDHL